MNTPWDYEPVGPFRISVGIFDHFDQIHTLKSQFDLTLERAVQLFAEHLPPPLGTWAFVTNDAEKRILAYARHHHGGESWAGCKAGYDLLAQFRPADEVTWLATIAENFDLQDLK